MFFDHVDFCQLELRETHEDDRRQANEEQLKGPEAHVRDRRKSVEANVLTTGLICIAFEIALKNQLYNLKIFFRTYAFISVDRSTNDGNDEGPEGEEKKQPGVTQRSTVVESFGDDAFNRPPNHLVTLSFLLSVLFSIVVIRLSVVLFLKKERAALAIYIRAKWGGAWRATRRKTLTDEDLTEPDRKRIIIR